ncbi:MAG: hypothetical protein Q8Q38_02335 [bacterium]|nr:hypothetical protein [bacterium]
MSNTKTFVWAVVLELALIAGTVFGSWVFWGRLGELKAQRAPLESEISVALDLCDFPTTEGRGRFLFLSLNSPKFEETKLALLQLAAGEGREVTTSNEYEVPSFSEFSGERVATKLAFNLSFSAPLEDAEQLLAELRDLPPASLEFGNESMNTQSLRSVARACEQALYLSRTLRLTEQFYLRQLAEKRGYDEALVKKVNQARNTASQVQESIAYLYNYTADRISVTIALEEKL